MTTFRISSMPSRITAWGTDITRKRPPYTGEFAMRSTRAVSGGSSRRVCATSIAEASGSSIISIRRVTTAGRGGGGARPGRYSTERRLKSGRLWATDTRRSPLSPVLEADPGLGDVIDIGGRIREGRRERVRGGSPDPTPAADHCPEGSYPTLAQTTGDHGET